MCYYSHRVCIKPIADLGATICGSIHVGQLFQSKKKVPKTLKPGQVYCLDFFIQHMYLTYDLTRNFVCLACSHTELPFKISCQYSFHSLLVAFALSPSTWSVLMQNKKKIEAYYIGSFDDQADLSPFGIISDQVNLCPPPFPPH